MKMAFIFKEHSIKSPKETPSKAVSLSLPPPRSHLVQCDLTFSFVLKNSHLISFLLLPLTSFPLSSPHSSLISATTAKPSLIIGGEAGEVRNQTF